MRSRVIVEMSTQVVRQRVASGISTRKEPPAGIFPRAVSMPQAEVYISRATLQSSGNKRMQGPTQVQALMFVTPPWRQNLVFCDSATKAV